MKLKSICLMAFVATTAALAQDEAQRAKLAGSWQAADQSAVWTFEDLRYSMHVTNLQGDRKIAEYTCDLGQECEVKDAGKKVKVTLYFNGPNLVVMETRGGTTFKRRFGVEEKSDVLEMENIPIQPTGKTETVRFTRLQSAVGAAKAAVPKP